MMAIAQEMMSGIPGRRTRPHSPFKEAANSSSVDFLKDFFEIAINGLHNLSRMN
jgi:hypothetical protein